MIPSGYKEDVVYSQIPTDGSGDMAFTRASNGTRINSAGLVEVVPWNLLQQSETFDNAPWTKNNATITANSTTAPNGTTTADTFTLNAGVDAGVYQAVNGDSNNYAISVYAKYVSGDKYLFLFSPLNSQGAKIWFDIQNGTISNQLSGFTGTIESVGGGWYKCSLYNTTQAVLNYIQFGISTTNSNRVLSNNSVSYFWGAQINTGALKPYFPTTDRLNVPRLTYQNGGGGCPSLLLEKQSSNTLSYSQDLTDAIWLKGAGLSVTGNTTTSPDGTQNAETITNTATSNCFLYQLASTSGATWTMSLYAKKGTNKYLGITLCSVTYQATSRYQPVFNLDNGTLQTINQSGSNETNTSYSITAVGDGWYRLTATATFAAGADQCYIVLQSSNNTSYTPASGNLDWTTPTTGNYYLWGVQGEVSSYPTSYIPTTSSSATRVADACSKTGISSLIGQTEGTLFADFNTFGFTNYDRFIALTDGVNNRIGLIRNTGNNRLYFFVEVSGTLIINAAGISGTNVLGRHKIAAGYKSGDYVVYMDGVQVYTSSASGVPATSQLFVGTSEDGVSANTMSGVISETLLFPTRLTNAELASLTTI